MSSRLCPIHSRTTCWLLRCTRVRQNTTAGRCPTSCYPVMKRRFVNGSSSSRLNGPSVCARICWKGNKVEYLIISDVMYWRVPYVRYAYMYAGKSYSISSFVCFRSFDVNSTNLSFFFLMFILLSQDKLYLIYSL